MTKLERARDYMQRAILMRPKNPEFADRLFEEAKKLMIEALK